MTRCLDDILRQPAELRRCFETITGPDFAALMRGAAILGQAADLYIVGMGASWSAGMGAQAMFSRAGRPVSLVDASELMHQEVFRPGSAMLLLSRSGKSVEIVALLDRASKLGIKVVGVTNAHDSPLGKRSNAAVLTHVAFDHAISIVTYTTVALAAGLVSAASLGTFDKAALQGLSQGFDALPAAMAGWRSKLAGNPWFDAGMATYFLGRLGGLASAHEARLMWEETAKIHATALTTGGFRHGPQEIVGPGLRVGLFLDAKTRREEDLALARDLRKLGARVMVIGQGVPADAGDLVFELPPIPAEWQFVTEIVPVQVAAEHLAGLRGVD